jgi:hypothetical protein
MDAKSSRLSLLSEAANLEIKSNLLYEGEKVSVFIRLHSPNSFIEIAH